MTARKDPVHYLASFLVFREKGLERRENVLFQPLLLEWRRKRILLACNKRYPRMALI